MKLILFLALAIPSLPSHQRTEKATIVFYRLEEAMALDGRKPKVDYAGKLLVGMPEEVYFAIKVKPGYQVIKMRQKQSELEFDAEAGKTYYVQISQVPHHINFRQTTRLVPYEEAKYKVKKLKRLDVKHIEKRDDIEIVTDEITEKK